MLGHYGLWAGAYLSCHNWRDTRPRFLPFLPKDRPIYSPLTTRFTDDLFFSGMQSAIVLHKQDHYNDYIIYDVLTLSEAVETTVALTEVSVTCLNLKIILRKRALVSKLRNINIIVNLFHICCIQFLLTYSFPCTSFSKTLFLQFKISLWSAVLIQFLLLIDELI